MRKFKNWDSIPNRFEGHCYVEKWAAQYWIKKGKILHRDDGPAAVFDNGDKTWVINNLFHRLDGPAMFNGDEITYYISDEKIGEEYYWNHPMVVEYKLNQILAIQE